MRSFGIKYISIMLFYVPHSSTLTSRAYRACAKFRNSVNCVRQHVDVRPNPRPDKVHTTQTIFKLIHNALLADDFWF